MPLPPPDPPEIRAPAVLRGPFYSTEQHADSPKATNAAWRGIIISAPPQVTLGPRQPMVILRGHSRIQGTNYPADDKLKLFAVNVATKQEYTAIAGQRDPSPDEPPPPSTPPDPEVVKKMVFSKYFNTDLMATLGLPWTNATYRVRAQIGPIPSNEISIQVITSERR